MQSVTPVRDDLSINDVAELDLPIRSRALGCLRPGQRSGSDVDPPPTLQAEQADQGDEPRRIGLSLPTARREGGYTCAR